MIQEITKAIIEYKLVSLLIEVAFAVVVGIPLLVWWLRTVSRELHKTKEKR